MLKFQVQSQVPHAGWLLEPETTQALDGSSFAGEAFSSHPNLLFSKYAVMSNIQELWSQTFRALDECALVVPGCRWPDEPWNSMPRYTNHIAHRNTDTVTIRPLCHVYSKPAVETPVVSANPALEALKLLAKLANFDNFDFIWCHLVCSVAFSVFTRW